MSSLVYVSTSGDSITLHYWWNDLPEHEDVESRVLQIAEEQFGGIVGLINCYSDKSNEQGIGLTFTPEQYAELVGILDGYTSYNLVHARLICKWIDKYVRKENDGLDWCPVYCEILEGATND